MYLFLSRRGDNAEIQVRFPASPDTVWHEISRLNECGDSDEPVVITGIDCEIHDLAKYIECANLGDHADIRKLNLLVTQLEDFSQQEKQILSGVLYMDHASGLNDVLRIVGNVKNYELVPGAVSPESLGRWVVDQGLAGQEFAGSVRPYLNYETIGAEYFSQHNGVFTSNGYVKHREAAQVQSIEPRSQISIELASGSRTCRLALPASEEELEQARRTLGVDELRDGMICAIDNGYLWSSELPTEDITLDGANAFARYLLAMSDIEMRTFGGALEAEGPTTFSEAVCIAEDIDDYELVDVTESEYGRDALRMAGAGEEVFELLDGYADFERLGEALMEEDGVQNTSFGQIKRLSAPFPQQEMDQTMY